MLKRCALIAYGWTSGFVSGAATLGLFSGAILGTLGMTDILKPPPPVEELIADLDRRITEMMQDAYGAVQREEERSREWRRDRLRRLDDETRDLRRLRDAMSKASLPVFVPPVVLKT
jgi:hypothetical protein